MRHSYLESAKADQSYTAEEKAKELEARHKKLARLQDEHFFRKEKADHEVRGPVPVPVLRTCEIAVKGEKRGERLARKARRIR